MASNPRNSNRLSEATVQVANGAGNGIEVVTLIYIDQQRKYTPEWPISYRPERNFAVVVNC